MRAASGGAKPAVSGCGGAGRRPAAARPKRARGLGLPCGFHLDEGCNATNSTEATRTAAKRRSGGTARRRGQRTLATPPRRRGARGRHQAAQKACSPPCASLGKLLDDEAASTTGKRRRRRKPRVRVPVAAAHGAKGGAGCSGRRSRGCGAAYKGPGEPPWRAGRAGRLRTRPARAGVGLSLESGSATGWG
jgi:hypothetical protein